MNPRSLSLLALLLVLIPAGVIIRSRASDVATGAEASPPTLRAVGLMVNAPIGGGTADFPDLAFFGTFERTRVALRLDYPAGGLIDLRGKESSLAVFSDDRGTDLASADQFSGPFEMSPRIAEDGRSMVFVVASKQLPGASASALHVKGEVAVMCAERTETKRREGVILNKGTNFEVGPFSFKIEASGPSEWSEDWSVTLVSREDLAAVVRYALIDESGQEIELRRSMSISGGGQWQQMLECDRSFESATFLIEYWDSPELVKVPFDLTLGLGLGRAR